MRTTKDRPACTKLALRYGKGRERRWRIFSTGPSNRDVEEKPWIVEEKPWIQVAAAIIIKEGQYLIARRRSGTHLGGLWEFPGGKYEPGESLEDCLHREVSEELGVEVTPPRPFMVVQHDYSEKSVELHFFFCSILKREVRALDCDDFCWVKPEALSTYEFPEADRSVIASLVARAQHEQREACGE